MSSGGIGQSEKKEKNEESPAHLQALFSTNFESSFEGVKSNIFFILMISVMTP